MNNVLITGARGFIARHLAMQLREGGNEVIGTTRDGGRVDGYDHIVRAPLGDSLEDLFASINVSAVVHAANDTSSDAYARNTEGTRRWHDEAKSAGVPLQILLSSLSASPDAQSDYGRAKYDLENVITHGGGVCFRLGVVVGNGGMFAKIRDSVLGKSYVPLLDGGTARVHVLGINNLCKILHNTINVGDKELSGQVWNLQQPDPVTLRELMTMICSVHDVAPRFIRVPSLPALWATRIAELLGVKLPISSVNIKGLRQSRDERFPSHYERFGYAVEPLAGMVQEARAALEEATSNTTR